MQELRQFIRLLLKESAVIPDELKGTKREEDEMEHRDNGVKMRIQDVMKLLPELLPAIVPPTRTFILRLSSKTMYTAVENAKLDVVVVAKSGIKFPNGAGLQDKLNSLNLWCKVILLNLSDCNLGADGV